MHDSRDVIRWILQSAGRRFPYAPKDSPWLPSVVSRVVDYIAGPHSLHVSGFWPMARAVPPYGKEVRVPWTDAGPGSLPAVYSDSRFAFDGMERKAGTALECTPPSKDQTFALLVTVRDEASIFTRLGFSCTETSVGRSGRSSRTEECDRSGIARMCGRRNQSTLVGSQCLSELNS